MQVISPLGTYYAVRVGRQPGVYTDHEAFSAQVVGYSGAVSKRFKTEADATAFCSAVGPQVREQWLFWPMHQLAHPEND